jgi:hypothetical protein
MAHLAEHDSLTGLPNRLLFCDRVGQAISLARRHGGQAAVSCSWIWMASNRSTIPWDMRPATSFFNLSQNACWPVYATLIRSAGTEAMSSHAAPGYDIGLKMPPLQREECSVLGEVHSVDGHQLHVTASIGVSIYPDDGFDAETLISECRHRNVSGQEEREPELSVLQFGVERLRI